MRQPGRDRRLAGGAAPGRLARLLALFAILAYQPLAAFHFATDEAHLAHSTTSIQLATYDGETHRHPVHGPHGDGHDHADPLCDFCILAGVSLPPLPPAAGSAAVEGGPAAIAPAAAVRVEKRLRAGHPVRAPPRSV